MKRKLFFLLAIIATMWQVANAADPDTLWTKDLWTTGDIYQVQFLPDGKSVVAATGAGVSVFDVKTGDLIQRLNYPVPNNDNPCNSFAFNQDRTKLITSHNDNSIIVWDYEKGDTLKLFKGISLKHIKLLNDNTLISNGYSDKNLQDSAKILVFDFNIGKIIRTIQSPDKQIVITAFAIDTVHKHFAVVSVTGDNINQSRYIELWDLLTFNKIATLGTHENQVNDLAFSPDGKYLASADINDVFKVWDLNSKSLVKTLIHDTQGQNVGIKLVFSPNSGYIISSGGGGGNCTTRIWDLDSFKVQYQYEGPLGGYSSLSISQDSNLIAASASYSLYMLNSHWIPLIVKEYSENVTQVLYPNPSGNYIIIPFEFGISPFLIKISNLNGQVIKSINHFEPLSTNLTLDISSFFPGNYFVIVSYLNKTILYKFEKIR